MQLISIRLKDKILANTAIKIYYDETMIDAGKNFNALHDAPLEAFEVLGQEAVQPLIEFQPITDDVSVELPLVPPFADRDVSRQFQSFKIL